MKNGRLLFGLIAVILVLSSGCFKVTSQVLPRTIVSGKITDSKTGEAIQGANIYFRNTNTGTISNREGKYRLETTDSNSQLVFSYLGYKTEIRSIETGKEQTVDVRLSLSTFTLDEVNILSGRRQYRNKNNPAVELIEKVIEKKPENRMEKFSTLEFRQYEKIQFALSNMQQKTVERKLNKKYGFFYQNIDSTKRIGNRILPFFIKEVMSDHYFRNVPETSKEIVRAEKSVNLDRYFDMKGISAKMDYLYQDINIYDNEILFLTKKFISPIAGGAPLFYRYYIVDTLTVDATSCIRLFFTPRNKSDILFQGYLYVAPENNYAVRKVDMGLNPKSNIDWVQNISLTQDFEKYGDKGWLLSKEDISIDFGFFRNKNGLLGQRTTSRGNYKIEEPIDEKIFREPGRIERLLPGAETEEFWIANRPIPLAKSEQGIYAVTDSISKMKPFKTWMSIIMMYPNDFINLGKIELGPEDNFFSSNPVEGNRVRLGGRTTPDLSKKLAFDGYLAYGFSDKKSKFGAEITYSFTDKTIYEFPVRSLSIGYRKDLSIPGQELRFLDNDNFFSSFKRGVDDKYLFNKIFRIEYLNEFENHFSFLAGYHFTNQAAAGNLHFNTVDYLAPGNKSIDISELYLNLRYAPNETFYQKRLYREPYPSKYPVIQLKYAVGSKSIQNDYNYNRLQLEISKRFYLSVVGHTDASLEAGKIFGQVSFPLLFIHRANQTYGFDLNSYNLMNFLEFVSDQYIAVNIDHSFNGFFLNKIPLFKRLKLREVANCKILYGGLRNQNNPDYHSNLFRFPVNETGEALTYTLEKRPYIEASIGVANILKVIRVDFVKRFTYLKNPNVAETGIRFLFGIYL